METTSVSTEGIQVGGDEDYNVWTTEVAQSGNVLQTLSMRGSDLIGWISIDAIIKLTEFGIEGMALIHILIIVLISFLSDEI